MMWELVSRRTRTAFREVGSGFVLRVINNIWQDEGFAPNPDPQWSGGERRNSYQAYLDAVDWSDQAHVVRALRAFERTAELGELEQHHEALAGLERDGFKVHVALSGVRIEMPPVALSLREGALAALADPAAVHEGLDCISRAVDDGDYAQAIGSAKELVESTAKLVLRSCGELVDDKDDLPALVSKVQRALDVHPSSARPGPDNSDAVKKDPGRRDDDHDRPG